MRAKRSERGDSKLGCLLWTVVLLVGAAIAWVAIPVKVRTADFHDFMTDQAVYATRVRSSDLIKKHILKKAQELQIPIDPKHLKVVRSESRIKIDADYTVPLEFPFGWTYQWHFHHEVDRPLFYY